MMPTHFWRAAGLFSLSALLICCSRARAIDAPVAAVAPAVAPAADVKPVELFKLKNEDLLKQAQALHTKAESDYRAQLRDLATAEMLLADARQKLAAVRYPAAPATNPKPSVKTLMDAAKAKSTVAADRQKLAQLQKALLDRVATALDSAQTADTGVLNAVDDLKAFTIEISLRIADGTLDEKDAPPELKAEALGKTRDDLNTARATRKARAAALTAEQSASAKAVEDADKAVLTADAELTQASNALTQEQQGQELMKQFASRPPAELAAELKSLAEEGIGLKGTFEVGLAQFLAIVTEADKHRSVVAALKQPEVKIPQLTRPEDVEQAAKATQVLADFYDQRAKAQEALAATLTAVVKQGAEFDADATVSSKQLFKMRVIAEVLKRGGSTPALIPEADPQRVLDAEARVSKQVAAVRAAVEKAKTDAPLIEKQLAETRSNLEKAATQLTGLKQSQDATLSALAFEGTLKDQTADQVIELFKTTAKSLEEKKVGLEKVRTEYKSALAAATALTAKLEGLKDPFLRAAEEASQSEKSLILGEMRKDAGLERASAGNGAPAAPATSPAAAAAPPVDSSKAILIEKPAVELTALEKSTLSAQAFQQLVAGRVRVLDEQETVSKDLLAAIEKLESAGKTYGAALAESRQLTRQLQTTAIDLKKRIGKGEVTGDKAPAEIAMSLRPELLAVLEADNAALLASESQFRQEKTTLQKPNADREAGKAFTRQLLTFVGQRLDLLSDLKTLDAAARLPRKDRDPVSLKRLEQEAAERQDAENGRFDAVLSIDSGKYAKNLAELLETDYRELVELEEKLDNLRQQREKAEQLVQLSQKEQAAVAEAMPLLDKYTQQLESAREEDAMLARARLKPDQADELLKAFFAKTGRQLTKPVPVGEKEKAEKVAELASSLFEKTVQVTAAKNWIAALAARLAPGGVKAEAGAYQDEIARVNADTGAANRRVESLTGTKPPEPATKEAAAITKPQTFPAVAGAIAKTREELGSVRQHGLMVILIKLAVIILLALVAPRIIMAIVGRSMGAGKKQDEHGNSALVLTAMRAFVKTAVWITAIAVILSVLGFDVTAIVAGLGIGGLAIGLAAQPMISDIISAVIIFAERRFGIGDVIKIGATDPAKVVGLTWRGTQLKGSDGLVVNVPNRNITSEVVRNLTKEGQTYDSLSINISTKKNVDDVLKLIKDATDECKHLTADRGYMVKEYEHKGDLKVIKYQFWWFLRDYDLRNRTRDEVFNRISANLAHENMAGTEVTLS